MGKGMRPYRLAIDFAAPGDDEARAVAAQVLEVVTDWDTEKLLGEFRWGLQDASKLDEELAIEEPTDGRR